MSLEIVDCLPQYWEFIRKLRLDSRVINGFIQNKPFSKEEQITYMKLNFQYYKVALYNGKPAGYFGVVENDIRVCTHPDFQGMGIGKKMIIECMKIWPNSYAKIKHGNLESERLFLSCGFLETDRDENFTFYKKPF